MTFLCVYPRLEKHIVGYKANLFRYITTYTVKFGVFLVSYSALKISLSISAIMTFITRAFLFFRDCLSNVFCCYFLPVISVRWESWNVRNPFRIMWKCGVKLNWSALASTWRSTFCLCMCLLWCPDYSPRTIPLMTTPPTVLLGQFPHDNPSPFFEYYI